MRRFMTFVLVPLAASATLFGCATYQYVTVSSDLPTNDGPGYLVENDSMAISYSFDGLNGPVKLSVRNKLDIPLYIDWKRSALVLNDESNTYFQDRARLEGSSDGYAIHWSPAFSTTTATVQGEIRRDESVGFIAPHSWKNSSMINVDSKFFELDEPRQKHRSRIQTSNGNAQAFAYVFEKGNTPLHFRSYLTLAFDPNFKDPITFDHEFWVTHVVETSVKPGEYHKSENEYYKSKTYGVGAVLVFGVIALLALGALGSN